MTTENTQRRYARVAGGALVMICSVGVLSNDLVVAGDAAATARNVLAHERQFRIGILGELVMLNCDVLLAAALYGLLKPVSAPLALAGALWRLGNAMLLAVGVVVSLVAVDLLGDARYQQVFRVGQVQAAARVLLDVNGTAAEAGLVLFGLGAATHACLLWKARYIPRVLSGLYVLVAVEVVASCLLIIVFPAVDARIDPWFILPDFVVELAVGLWLLVRGAKIVPDVVSGDGSACGGLAAL